MGKCDNEPLRANRYLGSWYFTLPIISGFVVAGVADVGVVTTGLEDGVGIKKTIASIWRGNMLGYLFTELSVATSKQFSESEALRVKYEEGKISG